MTDGKTNGSKWTQIGLSIGGGLILALQGVNLNETGQNATKLASNEELIKSNSAVAEQVKEAITRQQITLKNQAELLEKMNQVVSGVVPGTDIIKGQSDIIKRMEALSAGEQQILESIKKQ